ncbi:MAG: 50S ribosomal protein L18 [Bacteroidota bacterium]
MSAKRLDRRQRIKKGIRNIVSGSSVRPRLSVFRSNKAIYAQLVDDSKGSTIVSCSSRELGSSNLSVEVSSNVGKEIAKKATEKGIESIVFDRGGYLYHGKVKALADGAREGGLKF